MIKRIIKRVILCIIIIFLVLVGFLFLIMRTIFGVPPYAYMEAKRIGITLNENILNILIDFGRIKYKENENNEIKFSIECYQYAHDIDVIKERINKRRGKATNNYNEYLVLSAFFANPFDNIYNLDEYLQPDKQISDMIFSESFYYKKRYLELIKIEIEREEKKYYIKKIGDFNYDDDIPLSNGFISEKGTGYFEDGVEYIVVFYPAFSRFNPPAMPPIRFFIINGIPMIRMADY